MACNINVVDCDKFMKEQETGAELVRGYTDKGMGIDSAKHFNKF